MAVAKNAMEIFKVLDKSNCRECGEKTCLAFAAAVFCGTRRIQECPRLDGMIVARFAEAHADKSFGPDNELEGSIEQMKKQIAEMDYGVIAKRIGAVVSGDTLQVRMLGKLFGIRKNGTFTTDLHLIPWVVVPLLDYVLHCQGEPVTGEWLSYRELPGGKEKYALFKRGEDVLLQLADRYTQFFDDILHMFDGREVDKQFASDVSVVLQPFPLVPVMICYWRPEEGLASSLNLFFDASAGVNIGADSAFSLATGLAQMLEKLATHHGFNSGRRESASR